MIYLNIFRLLSHKNENKNMKCTPLRQTTLPQTTRPFIRTSAPGTALLSTVNNPGVQWDDSIFVYGGHRARGRREGYMLFESEGIKERRLAAHISTFALNQL